MEKDLPPFELYKGPGRRDEMLYPYVAGKSYEARPHPSWAWAPPLQQRQPERFRIEDTRKDVRDLIRAAVRDKFTGDFSFAPLGRMSCLAREEEEITREMLAWFDGLSETDFVRFFPREAAKDGIPHRRSHIVESFEEMQRSFQEAMLGEDSPTKFRVDVLIRLRAIFGDRPWLMPRELKRFAKFRKTDSLANVQKLATDSIYAAVADCKEEEARKKYLTSLAFALTHRSIFNDMAVISGLDRRHKDDMHSTGDLY